MASAFIFAFDAIVPLIIIACVGKILYRLNVIDDRFIDAADRLVFCVCLPCLLFSQILSGSADLSGGLPLILFCVSAVLILFAVLCAAVLPSVKDRRVAGVVIQGIFRSNFAIFGIAFTVSLGGNTAGAYASAAAAFIIPIYNILAVVILNYCGERSFSLQTLKKIGLNIIKNPLIISIFLALPFFFAGVRYGALPAFFTAAVSDVSALALPVALISIGAKVTFTDFFRYKYALAAVNFAKLIAVPLAAVTAARLLGFDGPRLVVVMVLFGTSTAVSSYIMAKNQSGDPILAGQIVMTTTVFSAPTLFLFTFVLKYLGWI